jgi:hypothetical protein
MLYISTLLQLKRFRYKGNKDGAVRAIKMLESAGIGRVFEDKPTRGATAVSYCVGEPQIQSHNDLT